MRALIQRVSQAQVSVAGKVCASIQQGLVALVGISHTDEEATAQRLLQKIVAYRIFADKAGKMNLSLADIKGELLLVPQFTLVADTQKGTRPGFSSAMPPAESEHLFNYLVQEAKAFYPKIAVGIFGATMQVSLCNEGPVTFLLETH